LLALALVGLGLAVVVLLGGALALLEGLGTGGGPQGHATPTVAVAPTSTPTVQPTSTATVSPTASVSPSPQPTVTDTPVPPSFTVTGANAVASPACATPSSTVTITATITTNSTGGTITYTWLRDSDTTGMDGGQVVVPQGQTSISVQDSWTLPADISTQSHSEQLEISAPNSITSNPANFVVQTTCP
jgi:hypothetical protein